MAGVVQAIASSVITTLLNLGPLAIGLIRLGVVGVHQKNKSVVVKSFDIGVSQSNNFQNNNGVEPMNV